MKIECSDRLNNLPPYIFTRIKKLTLEAYKKKLDVIDLSMGNPDICVPECVIERLCDTVKNHPRTHRYPQAKGMPKFRKTISEWMKERFNVELDPETEILALIGSKEGVAHLCMTFLNTKDIAIIPDPGYPVYYNGVILAGGCVYRMPLLEKNKYLPELEKIPEKIARKARLLFINYPNNPTASVVEDISFFKEVIKFAKKYNIIIIHDNAYSELTFDGYIAPSFLQVPGAKDVGVEFHSFSKTYSMAGWRVGFVCGNRYIISALEKFKSFVDYGCSTFIQLSAIVAMKEGREYIKKIVEEYTRRRDRFIKELARIGWNVEKPKATMYIWAKIPDFFKNTKYEKSLEFCSELIEHTGVAIAPGSGFGEYGEGYVRMALVTHINRFHDAVLRFKEFFKKFKNK